MPVTPFGTPDAFCLIDFPCNHDPHQTCDAVDHAIEPLFLQLFDTQQNLPSMYGGSQQRSTSNPRAYATPDMSARDDSGQGAYDSGYPNYQQGGYTGMQNVNYQYGAQGMG